MMESVKAEVRGLRMRVLSALLEKGGQSSEARPSEPGSPKELGPVLALPETGHGRLGFISRWWLVPPAQHAAY